MCFNEHILQGSAVYAVYMQCQNHRSRYIYRSETYFLLFF